VPNSNLILSERIHDVLRERLVSHQIRPGDHVRQDSIATEFGMSKIPVREALTKLEANGLVISTHHKGYLAAPLSLAEVDELYALRMLVEPVTTALAARMADGSQRALVRNRLEALPDAPERLSRNALERFELIKVLVAPAKRPTTASLIRTLFFRTERYVPLIKENSQRDIKSVRQLLEAWIAGDEAEVSNLYIARLKMRWTATRQNLGVP
jgi:DNA-binding GntR family transcriptional regulator